MFLSRRGRVARNVACRREHARLPTTQEQLDEALPHRPGDRRHSRSRLPRPPRAATLAVDPVSPATGSGEQRQPARHGLHAERRRSTSRATAAPSAPRRAPTRPGAFSGDPRGSAWTTAGRRAPTWPPTPTNPTLTAQVTLLASARPTSACGRRAARRAAGCTIRRRGLHGRPERSGARARGRLRQRRPRIGELKGAAGRLTRRKRRLFPRGRRLGRLHASSSTPSAATGRERAVEGGFTITVRREPSARRRRTAARGAAGRVRLAGPGRRAARTARCPRGGGR